jgi:hypothetical protein
VVRVLAKATKAKASLTERLDELMGALARPALLAALVAGLGEADPEDQRCAA